MKLNEQEEGKKGTNEYEVNLLYFGHTLSGVILF
jgi:hypothetical protein